MKFELVEPPEPDEPGARGAVAEQSADRPVPRNEPDESDGDPVAGINAAAERLAAHARAGGERVDASVARLAALMSRQVSGGWTGRAVAPPSNFRAGRFTGKEREG